MKNQPLPSVKKLQEPNDRKTWQEPAMIFDRPLEAVAQDGPPSSEGGKPSFMGPLGLSGGGGVC